MKKFSTALLAAALTIGLGGIAQAGLATNDTYNFTVWSGTYASLGIGANADLANTPGAIPSVSFTYTGSIDFSTTDSANLAGEFFGTAGTISNYVDDNGKFPLLSDFLTTDTLSTTGFSGASLVTFMQITGTYTASPGTTVTVTHDDGASLYNGIANTLVVDSAGPVSKTATTGTLIPTGPGGSNFMLDYVEANGAPSVLQVTETLPIPEPASLALLGTALLGLGLVLRRRK